MKMKSRFETLEVSLDLVRAIRPWMEAIRRRDAELARQIRDAASSACLNLGEGRRRAGKDRTYHYRIAAGSADEATVGLRLAEAWGHVSEASILAPLKINDRLQAMLWSLTN